MCTVMNVELPLINEYRCVSYGGALIVVAKGIRIRRGQWYYVFLNLYEVVRFTLPFLCQFPAIYSETVSSTDNKFDEDIETMVVLVSR